MGFEKIPNTDLTYGLISYDADGRERPEPDGLMTKKLLDRLANDGITNVFFFCHGWKGDLPAARDQYGRWIGALMQSADRQRAATVFPNFKPLLIGLHWPSLPWGDEELKGSQFAASAAAAPQALLKAYLDRLGDRPDIREPLEIIIEEARRNAAPTELPPAIREAYLALNKALGLGSGGVAAPPDADREEFDPDESFDAANEEPTDFGGDLDLGGLLGPLRQLSYWTMKKRGRTVGEGGMHTFLKDLQNTSPSRIHLMGHSFGTIVVSGMVGGPGGNAPLPRPVDSLVLVQGAVSLWSYAAPIPLSGVGDGYFGNILRDGKVRGPIVTTRSRHDSAVGVLYQLASKLRGSPNFDPVAKLPKFGAIGTFGLQGLSNAASLDMLDAAGGYSFTPGNVYNLEASKFIAKKEGVSGAHNDVGGPEVAHAIWAAAFASKVDTPVMATPAGV
jgi:hypothetical protein